ncbi:MAG: hypothetical protein HYV26_24210 [Candidatus Hydrogenedentes bacterium]|nr:hypothetical protein [Candidatus Hydrogenedentota bacterium]
MQCTFMSLSILLTSFSLGSAAGDAPKIIAYYAQPNAYLTDHAREVAELYDGFFFTLGSWDEGVQNNLGFPPEVAPQGNWLEQAASNLKALTGAGATESLLGIHFGDSAPWPSAETLLSAEYTAKLARHFGRAAAAARELGFRGLSIDVEYPYPRYEVDHEIYAYEDYTVDDLLSAGRAQGAAVMSAVLDAFPEAVIFVLPGVLWTRPIDREFTLGMLQVMQERDAPGGLHLGAEVAYSLLDPVTQVAIPRVGDCSAEALLTGPMLEYWRRRCTVAPGVWPMHMVETGGKDYPKRPWVEELTELREQMAILRCTAKRYIWSFSGQPMWYMYTDALGQQYGLSKQTYEGAEEAIPGWQAILREATPVSNTRLGPFLKAIKAYDRGRLSPLELCRTFGSPGQWLVLGLLGNPFTTPQFFPGAPAQPPLSLDALYHGRDGVVRWFSSPDYSLLGDVSLMKYFDWRATDNAAAILATQVVAKRDQRDAHVWLGWDDGAVVRLDGRVVMDHAVYPERGHGTFFRDRYNFEDHVAMPVTAGRHLLTITSINSHGSWGVNLRIADADGYPLSGIRFETP